jgi:ESS family glutamate:Na+ symporter
VRFIQAYFIPPSLLAGFLGLLVGPNCFGILPLSTQMGTYAGILIAFIFGCLPFSSSEKSANRTINVTRMWAFSQAGMLLQYALGGLLGIFLLSKFWHVNEAFGIAMPCGYCGGHGTAAAVGSAFGQLGYDDMLTLAMTAATVGIVAAVVLGVVFVKWGTQKGYTTFLTDFKDLPHDLRTGLLSPENRDSIGTATVSSISIDPLTFNLALIAIVALGGYGISQAVAYFFPQLGLPVFSCAFVFGILLKQVLKKSKAYDYFCPKTIGHISGAFTDYLVAFGIASIKLSIVIKYIVPLLILLGVGLVLTAFYIFFFAPRILKDCWFEKSLFTWGWYTGTVAMGLALLRIVDPDKKSQCMEDYAMAYIFIAPVEISLITFVPMAFCSGYGLLFTGICLLAGLAILLFAHTLNKKK